MEENVFVSAQVGVETGALGDDGGAAGAQVQCRVQHLGDVHRDGIADHHLAGVRPDQGSEAIPIDLGQVEPVLRVPTADQPLGPFLAGGRLDLGEGGLGRRAEGIAVEIDQALGQVKEIAHRRQRVGGVEFCGPAMGSSPEGGGITWLGHHRLS